MYAFRFGNVLLTAPLTAFLVSACWSDAPVEPDLPLAFSMSNGVLTGQARLHQVGGSRIKARLSFNDDGTTLTVEGTAKRLNPANQYGSLIYPNPGCMPGAVFLGFWSVNPDGSGTLAASVGGGVLATALSSSVRNVSAGNQLVACGNVKSREAK